MKIRNLLDRIYKITWTGKITMTTQNLGLVITVAAVSGAIATALAKRGIKRIVLKILTPKPRKVSDSKPREFHQTVCSAEFPNGCIDS